MHIEDNLRSGMTTEEARRDALIRLGGVEPAKEACRDRRGVPWLEALFSPGYFHTLQMGLLEGRDFQQVDANQGARVAIVNEPFARKHWPGESALGKRFRCLVWDHLGGWRRQTWIFFGCLDSCPSIVVVTPTSRCKR